ncbi:MAG: hypothetical protein ACLQPH_11805 [Acidimicrobiales bacterium]
MNDERELLSKAEQVIGTDQEILAAGIFGHQDPAATTMAAMAGAAAGSAALDDPVIAGLGGAASVHAAREAVAASKGLTTRMLVAVTRSSIHVLDWKTGDGPTRELATFERASTKVRVGKFGLSRRVSFSDTRTDRTVALTGTTAFFASEAKGDRAVLRTLQEAS